MYRKGDLKLHASILAGPGRLARGYRRRHIRIGAGGLQQPLPETGQRVVVTALGRRAQVVAAA